MNTAIMTGGRGFIGTAVRRELEDNGWKAACIVGDDLTEVPEKADVFLHFKWNVKELATDGKAQIESIRNSLNMLELAAKSGCKKFIFASSIMEEEMSIIEQDDELEFRPVDVYAAAKRCAAVMLKVRARELGIEFIKVTITNVYGPGENSGRFIQTTLQRIIDHQPLEFTEGSQNYDFVYIDDAAHAFRLIAEQGRENRQYVLGSGKAKPLREYIIELCEAIPEASDPLFGANKSLCINLPKQVFSIASLQKDTNWQPEVSFKDGILQTYEDLSERSGKGN